MKTYRWPARPCVLAVSLLAIVLGNASRAAAKEDWIGWLEEFSGPGPFRGFELSAEIMCLNVTERRTVAVSDLENAFPKLKTATAEVASAYQAFASVGLGIDAANTRALGAELTHPTPKGPRVDALLRSLKESLGARLEISRLFMELDEAVEKRRAVVLEASAAAILGGTGTSDIIKATTSKRFTAPGWFFNGGGSCPNAKNKIDGEGELDRTRTAQALAEAGLPGSSGELVVARRNWETGIVVTAGRYVSSENRLFDPQGTRTDEPQLRVVPVELLAHHKLSPAIDIGAGFGMAFFHTDFRNDQWAPTKSAAFYVIPLSVVVRPARMFTDARWGSILGYRMSVRYFGDLNGADFGAPTSDFKQHGEFVWGASAFVDLVTLFGRGGKTHSAAVR